jgi:predicted kinase
MKQLILLRGLPGSGKSTLAKSLGCYMFEADQYFIDSETGEYKFDMSKIKLAHDWCKLRVEHSMEDGLGTIVVANTFTREWEMDAYFELAEKYGYQTFCLIVENRHGGVNEHGCPDDKIEQMKNRFEIKL